MNCYRCPEISLRLRVSEHLSPDAGYFSFGPGVTCYGRSLKQSHQQRTSAPLRDALTDVAFEGGDAVLPFDPGEVIDNLRMERYPGAQLNALENLFKHIYYRFRPFMGRALRARTQKFRAANWQRMSFPRWPVDTTVEDIHEGLLLLSLRASGLDRIPFIWFWPNGARACVAMTHDVETAAGRDFCARLLKIDESFGIRASYQIVPEGRYAVSSEFLNSLRDSGAEVCVQDLNHDGRLFDNRQEFLRRVARINRYVRDYGARGYRSAVLYRRQEWYGDFEVSFDMSIPNVVPLDPQRGGCCTVMPYFIGDVLELPVTTIQDYTLFRVLGERSIGLWKAQTGTIFAKNGLAQFIVHPDYIAEPDTQAVYLELLAMLRKCRERESLWFALPGEIDSWWRARNAMRLEKDGNTWRIVGEGAENAVVALAKEVNGKLEYELGAARESPKLHVGLAARRGHS